MALLVDNQVGDEGVTIICPTNIPPALFQNYPFLVINCRANLIVGQMTVGQLNRNTINLMGKFQLTYLAIFSQ